MRLPPGRRPAPRCSDGVREARHHQTEDMTVRVRPALIILIHTQPAEDVCKHSFVRLPRLLRQMRLRYRICRRVRRHPPSVCWGIEKDDGASSPLPLNPEPVTYDRLDHRPTRDRSDTLVVARAPRAFDSPQRPHTVAHAEDACARFAPREHLGNRDELRDVISTLRRQRASVCQHPIVRAPRSRTLAHVDAPPPRRWFVGAVSGKHVREAVLCVKPQRQLQQAPRARNRNLRRLRRLHVHQGIALAVHVLLVTLPGLEHVPPHEHALHHV